MERHLADCFHHSFRVHDDQGECIYRYHSDYLGKLDKLLKEAKDDSNKQQICQVGKLEDGCKDISHRYDTRSVILSQIHKDNAGTPTEIDHQVNGLPNDISLETLIPCGEILSLKGSWAWVIRLHDATGVHLRNAANYHQFYLDMDEYGKGMNTKLPMLIKDVQEEKFKPTTEDGRRLLQKGKDLLFSLRFYQTKIIELLELSHSIVPVYKRTDLNKDPIPVRALCAFKGTSVEFREGEDLLLIDNSNQETWKVRTADGSTGLVPPPVILIPPPDPDAIYAVFRSLVQLLAHWSDTMKELGFWVFLYVTSSIKDWDENKEKQLKALPSNGKDDLSGLLNDSKKVFISLWLQSPQYQDLDKSVSHINETIKNNGSAPGSEVKNLQDHEAVVKDVLALWREMSGSWERYVLLTQLARWPEFLLMPNGWEDYGWSSMETVITKWREDLYKMLEMRSAGDDTDNALTSQEAGEDAIVADTAASTESWQQETLSKEYEATQEREEADAEAVMKASQEQKQVWVISSVVDPTNDQDISFDEATKKGILRMEQGMYFNPKTRQSKPIPEAMNEGLIIMTLKSMETSQEKKTSYGVMTVTTSRLKRSYTIKRVMDTETEEFISIDEAKRRGILDLDKPRYYDREEKQEIPLTEAIELGLLEVEYDETDRRKSDLTTQTVTRTYAVHGVVDQRKQKKVTFDEAISSGILDMDEDVYVNNVTRDKIVISEAIRRGLIKAKLKMDADTDLFEEEENMFKKTLGKLKTKLMATKILGE